MARFVIVGVFNMGLDFVIYLALTRSSDFFATYYPLAALVAFLVAGLNSYVLNKHWTFKDRLKFKRAQLLKFYAAAAIGLALNIGLLAVMVELSGMDDRLAKIAASVCVGGWNFLLQKFWVFRNKL